MLISYNLLKNYIDFDISINELSDRLTMQGLEVEEIVPYGSEIQNVVVGHILAMSKHPDADKLTICTVNNGNEDLQIICGASNMKVGDKVCLAQIGAELPNGLKIKKSKIRGIESYGMLCSKEELHLEKESNGIWIIPPDSKNGDLINQFLPQKDHIFNISLTANRGDCLSLLGVAREIGGMTGKSPKYPQNEIKINPQIKTPSIKILDKDLCPRYSSRIIRGVKIKESPDWLKEALIKLGSRPINNVVDITNFVLLELGHPLHAFDLNKLNGQQIIVRRANNNEKILGIDQVDRKLSDEMLIIADEKDPVAIAGVMGGHLSSVNENTKDLLLESAYFKPESIRVTSKKLDCQTDSSYRFERGTDFEGIIRSLDRCAYLIQEICGGEISDFVDIYPNKLPHHIIPVRVSFINQRLGINLTKKEIIQFLEPLGFIINDQNDDNLSIKVPTFKTDVHREIDIAEEVARIFGYNKIPENIPPIQLNPDHINTHRQIDESIRYILSSAGLNEVINYSFASEKESDKLKLNTHPLIKTKNPLTSDNESLRNDLLPNLINNLITNIHHGNHQISLFEIGNIFYHEKNHFTEKKNLGMLLYGLSSEKDLYHVEKPYDFYDLKGHIENLIESLGEKDIQWTISSESFLHPSKCTSIAINNHTIGYCGEIHPEIISSYKLKYPVLFAQLDIHNLEKLVTPDISYKEIIKFPETLRDLAILVDHSTPSQNLVHEINKSSKYVKNIKIIDVYQGKHIPEGKKSIAYSITFQDSKQTLSDDLVNKEMDQIISRLSKNCGGEMRLI